MVLLLLLLAGSSVTWAASEFVVRTNYYTITGSNAWQLDASIRARRPWTTNGIQHATTVWDLRWHYTFRLHNDRCRLDRVETHVNAVLTLPRWTASNTASPRLVERWRSYSQALVTHEAGHLQLAREAAGAVEHEIAGLGEFTTAQELDQKVTEMANHTLRRYHEKEQEYDQRTLHGATQGAQFPLGPP